jgi:hypothetical protein
VHVHCTVGIVCKMYTLHSLHDEFHAEQTDGFDSMLLVASANT